MINHQATIFSLLVLCLASNLAQCKPVELFPQHIHKTIIKTSQDLIALPSEQRHLKPQQQQDRQQHEYVIIEQDEQHPGDDQAVAQPTVEQQQPDHHRHQQEQEVVYYMLPNGQTIEASQYIQQQQQQHQEQPSHEVTSNQPQTTTLVETADPNTEIASNQQLENGYPGEVIYANQEGQLLRQVDGSFEPMERTARYENQKYERPSVELVTSTGQSLRDSRADLTATILTEVPVNDMSQEVLEQLKKDYGARVVATREYPGASLVINCGDSALNLDVSLCSGHKQPPISSYEPTNYEYSPVPTTIPYEVERIEPTKSVNEPATAPPTHHSARQLEAAAPVTAVVEHHVIATDADSEHEHEHDHEQERNENHDHQTGGEEEKVITTSHHQHGDSYERPIPNSVEDHHYQQQPHHSNEQQPTTVAYASPESATQLEGETTEQTVPTTGYANEEVTSSSNVQQQKSPSSEANSNSAIRSNNNNNNKPRSQILHQQDELSSISQQEEKIEK